MIIDLTRCAEQPVHVEQSLDVDPLFAGHAEIESLGEARLTVDCLPTGDREYALRGDVAVEVRAYCARCLEAFPATLSRRFDLRLVPETDAPASASDGELDERTIDLCAYRDDRVELLPLVEEQINLAFPMRFLCSEDCRGLCADCGTNRNRATCTCQRQSVHPGLEGLQQLLDC